MVNNVQCAWASTSSEFSMHPAFGIDIYQDQDISSILAFLMIGSTRQGPEGPAAYHSDSDNLVGGPMPR